MEKENKICSRCILDSTVPEIVFDEQGVCNFCRITEKMEQEYPQGDAGKQKLKRIVSEIKKAGKGKKYDCIVGVSGGRDSTYLLYTAVKLGLRPLAVHFDNGWDSEIAVSNIKNALDALKIDLETLVVDWEEFKDLQISFLKASVSDAEVPTDIGIFGTLHRIARREKIKYILNGHSFRTEGVMPLTWTYMDGRYIQSVQKKYGTKKLRTFPNFKAWDMLADVIIGKVKTVPLLNLVPYDQKKVGKILKKELNWQYYGGHHHESYYTNFFQSYLLPTKFGLDKRKIELSALIRSGQIKREKALFEIRNKYPYSEELVDYVLSKLNLTRREFDQFYRLPVKTFRDYPTYYKTMKLFRPIILLAVKMGILPDLIYYKFFPERIV